MEHDLEAFASFALENSGRLRAECSVIDLTCSSSSSPLPPPLLCSKCYRSMGITTREQRQHKQLCLQTSVNQEPRSAQRRHSLRRPLLPPLIYALLDLEDTESCFSE